MKEGRSSTQKEYAIGRTFFFTFLNSSSVLIKTTNKLGFELFQEFDKGRMM